MNKRLIILLAFLALILCPMVMLTNCDLLGDDIDTLREKAGKKRMYLQKPIPAA